MTRILPSGIEAKTGYAPEVLRSVPMAQRHYVELGHDVNPFPGMDGEPPSTNMMDAVFALGEAFQNEALTNDATFCKFKDWLATFEVKVVMWWFDRATESHEPAVRFKGCALPDESLIRYDSDNPGPVTKVLGHDLSRDDIMDFTIYLMNNSAPEGPNDPRYSLINSLKS